MGKIMPIPQLQAIVEQRETTYGPHTQNIQVNNFLFNY